jgi:hypothetical protein
MNNVPILIRDKISRIRNTGSRASRNILLSVDPDLGLKGLGRRKRSMRMAAIIEKKAGFLGPLPPLIGSKDTLLKKGFLF